MLAAYRYPDAFVVCGGSRREIAYHYAHVSREGKLLCISTRGGSAQAQST